MIEKDSKITAKKQQKTRKKKKIKKRLKKLLTFKNDSDILRKSLGGTTNESCETQVRYK